MNTRSPFVGPGAAGLSADPPERYRDNYARYLALGGQQGLADDLQGFVAGGANTGDLARFWFFSLAFDQIVKEGLGGDLAELGVYKGATASLLAAYARRLGATAWLLDTYEGFDPKDLTGFDADIRAQDFTDTSLAAVRARVGDDNVQFVKGYFPASASQLPADGRYCLVHLDCDLYAPMASALAYFYPRLVPGGFLIAHDYSSLHWSGAETAIDEFFLDKPECPMPLPDGAGSVAVRKLRPPDRHGSWLDRRRRAVLGADWAEAANGGLIPLLGEGWSGPEPWGVWGVGERHVLYAPLPAGAGDLALELDVEAVTGPGRLEQTVAVAVDGREVEPWTFSLENNRAVRSAPMPARRGRRGRTVALTFTPQSVMPASDVHDCADRRSLGLGLHRLRWRPSDKPARPGFRFWRAGKP